MASAAVDVPKFLLTTSTGLLSYSSTTFSSLSTSSTSSSSPQTSASSPSPHQSFHTPSSSLVWPDSTTHTIKYNIQTQDTARAQIIIACVVTGICLVLIMACCGFLFRIWLVKRDAKRENRAAAERGMPAGWTAEDGYAAGQTNVPLEQVTSPARPAFAPSRYRYA